MPTPNINNYEVGRQDVLVAKAKILFGSAVSGSDFAGVTGTKTAISVPAGAIVVGGFYRQVSGTTTNVDVHVGDGGVDNRYANNVDAAAAATTVLTPTGYKYTEADTIDIMVDTANPAAGGEGLLVVQYIIDGRAAFVQK